MAFPAEGATNWKTSFEAELDASYVHVVKGLDRTGANAAGNTTIIQNALNAGGVVRIEGSGTVAHTGLTLPDGVVFQGTGRSGVLLHNTNASGGHGITTAAATTSGEISNFRMDGVAGSGDCIHLAADWRAIRLVNLQLNPVGHGVDVSAGNGVDLFIQNVRVNGGTGCFNLSSAGVAVNTITAINCYAQGASGPGWSTANVFECNLIGCSSDGNAGGWQLGGNVNLIGCSSEASSIYGFAVLGGGNLSFDGCSTYNQTVPYRVDAAATVTFKNIVDASTVGTVSLDITANATGRVYLESHALTQSINIGAGAVLRRRDTDDERGKFTPTLYGSTTAGAHTYATQQGFYDVVGGMVFIRVSLRVDSAGWDATCAGNLRIGGLPSPALVSTRDSGPPAAVNFNYFNLGTGYYTVWAKFNAANYIGLFKDGTGVNENFLAATDRGAGTAVLIDFWAVWMASDVRWTNL